MVDYHKFKAKLFSPVFILAALIGLILIGQTLNMFFPAAGRAASPWLTLAVAILFLLFFYMALKKKPGTKR